MTKLRILYFDIETCPAHAWVWSTGKQYVTADQILEDSKIICIAWKYDGESKCYTVKWDTKQSDKALLQAFSKVASKADTLIGHNGKDFDIRHINARLAYHGLEPLPILSIQDTLKDSRKTFRLASHSLAYLAKYFKVGTKVKHAGMEMWLQVWLENDRNALNDMVEYCVGDIKLLEKVFQKIKPYIKTVFNHAMAERRICCPSCNAQTLIRDRIRVRASGRRVQDYKCKACGKFCHIPIPTDKITKTLPR